jgi:hypothetical protein
MAFRFKHAALVVYNGICSLTIIALALLLIFRHQPIMALMWRPVIVGVYVVLIGLIISVTFRIRGWAIARKRQYRGFPIEPSQK